MQRRCLVLVLSATLLVPSAVAAQGQPSLASALSIGSRVRFTSTSVQTPLKGTVVGLDDRSLTVAPEAGPPLTIPLPELARLDVGRGHKRHWLRGLGAGLLVGLALGLTFPVDPDDCDADSANFCSRGEALLGSTLVFGTVGVGVGGLVRSEQWAPVTLGMTPRPSSAGQPRGFRLAVQLRF